MIGCPEAGEKMLFGAIISVCASTCASIGERQVNRHLVTVEVRVESRAHQRVHLDRVALDQNRLEGLDAHAVKRRSAVQHHRMLVDDLFENVPDLVVLALQHLLGALDGVGEAELLEATDDEGLVQFEGDLLGQTALVQSSGPGPPR